MSSCSIVEQVQLDRLVVVRRIVFMDPVGDVLVSDYGSPKVVMRSFISSSTTSTSLPMT